MKTKASRINALNQVIQDMKSGMTVVEECREVGVPGSYIGAQAVTYGVIGTWE
jgi:hypothetical protein